MTFFIVKRAFDDGADHPFRERLQTLIQLAPVGKFFYKIIHRLDSTAILMFDDDECLRRYQRTQDDFPDWFDNPANCPTHILTDRDDICAAQQAVYAERHAAGFQTDDLRVGVLAEDHYMGKLIRDAVRFADGKLGLYNRVVATGGVVVLPILADGIALIRIFRHGPRRWSLEAPQGLLLPNSDPKDEARRELIEEMGATVEEVVPLGIVYTSTALTSENLKMFAARISAVGKPQRSEGIDSIHRIAKADIDRLVLDGTICDGPTMSLILRSRQRGLL